MEKVLTGPGAISILTTITGDFYKDALNHLGTHVTCPFAYKHRNGEGLNDFRLHREFNYGSPKDGGGRGICSCCDGINNPSNRGIDLYKMLIWSGFARDYKEARRLVLKAYQGTQGNQTVKAANSGAVVAQQPMRDRNQPDAIERRARKLAEIWNESFSLLDPRAKPARKYFKNRGIPFDKYCFSPIIRFHPGLEYWVFENKKWVMKGIYPAIVSEVIRPDGTLCTLHKIHITVDGYKAIIQGRDIKKVMPPKIANSLNGSAVRLHTVRGCRTLHVTEGVEKAHAVHLLTRQTVWAADACGRMAQLDIPKGMFDELVIWSDNNLARPQEVVGVGQVCAYNLAKRYQGKFSEGVSIMLPKANAETNKGAIPDWENIIVESTILRAPLRVQREGLKVYAENPKLVFEMLKNLIDPSEPATDVPAQPAHQEASALAEPQAAHSLEVPAAYVVYQAGCSAVDASDFYTSYQAAG
ncbi:MAG: hypothetical protein V3T17_02940 [Pseudomonadales bacterium]